MLKEKAMKLSQSHIEKRIRSMNQVQGTQVPLRGWIYTIRTSLGMTLAQLGKRLNVSPQAIAQLEKREVDGQITLSSLRAALRALGVEGHHTITSSTTLWEIIRKQAEKKAREIVLRTSQTMALENQKNSDKHLTMAIRERANEIEKTLPKYLWD
jgi:predicted DNA-binding mobile mystery protein A